MNNVTLHAPRYVLGDLLLTRLKFRDVALVLGGAGLIGLSAQIAVPVPGSPVPVTGQTLAFLLVGAAFGPWRGPLAALTYVLAGIAGVPWFAHGSSGFVGATFGYLLGMTVAAAVVGELSRRGADRTPWRVIPTMLLATAIVYAFGVTWLAVSLHLGVAAALSAGLYPFLLGDLLKVAIAAGLLPVAWRFTHRTR